MRLSIVVAAFIPLIVAAVAAPAAAATFKPARDDLVLERLPGPAAPASLAAARARLAADPRDVEAALSAARALIAAGRNAADPRAYGQAEAVLAPWWDEANPPLEVRLLRASILQFGHRFDAALADLDAVLAARPDDAGARMMQATVLLVAGEPARSLAACQQLDGRRALLRLACAAAASAALGDDEAASPVRLEALADALGASDPEAHRWALVTAGEIALRRGDARAAARILDKARALAPDDVYGLAALADALLAAGDAAAVTRLLAGREAHDALLLRLAAAAKAAGGDRAAATLASELAARFAAERERGARPHLREEAYFRLHVQGDAEAALTAALGNWATQKDWIDARLVLDAARAAGRPDAARPVVAWREARGIREAAL